jgi:hypothetical protein
MIIDPDDVQFFLYDDDGDWAAYEPARFRPV